VSGVSTRGKGLVGMEHIRDNGCPAWGPLSVSEFAFVSHELPLHMKFHPLMWFIYVLYLLPCNFLLGCRVFETGVLTFMFLFQLHRTLRTMSFGIWESHNTRIISMTTTKWVFITSYLLFLLLLINLLKLEVAMAWRWMWQKQK